MASLQKPSDSAELAMKLVTEGPHKMEAANRRIRALLGGVWILDTVDAQYVWEHAYYPVFYVPLLALESGGCNIHRQVDQQDAGYWTGTGTSEGKTVQVVAHTKGPLAGLVKIQMGVPDIEWFAEDERLLGGHPKDPYKRIEILPSSREIRVQVNGLVVAQSTSNMFLYETMLRTRYYLPATSVKNWTMLTKSDTITFCPYKGHASYYDLRAEGTFIKDAVWYYTYPTHESSAIQGLLCFYNEKVDIFVDGERENN